ncbi:hypothetical protein GYH30_015988 [Glycine max]|nr:hypothetical protein GYH30_015988 [Glycine max]
MDPPRKKKKGRYDVAELKTLGNQLLLTFVSPPHHVLESLLSHHSFFLPLLPKLPSSSASAAATTALSVVGDQSEFIYLSWLRSKFYEFLKSLFNVLASPQGDETLKELVLDTLMQFVKVANGGAFHPSQYHKLLHSIVYSTSPPTFLVDLLASKYLKHIDVRIQENYTKLLAFSYSIKTCLYLEIERTKLKSMVDQFAELGVRNKKLNQFIAKSPQLLLRKPKDFLQLTQLSRHLEEKLVSCCFGSNLGL